MASNQILVILGDLKFCDLLQGMSGVVFQIDELLVLSFSIYHYQSVSTNICDSIAVVVLEIVAHLVSSPSQDILNFEP